MAMSGPIQAAMHGFREIILGGIPFLLQRNETAFLSFMCSLSAVDALAAYRYEQESVTVRYLKFIQSYFPAEYSGHAEKLYILRCRMLHNFSPAHFSLVHAEPGKHLTASAIDTFLSDDSFFADLKIASENFFAEVAADPARQSAMDNRLANVDKGGAIYF